ncbi:MAG: hypothetical protein BSOLF_2583 [Candidatus Carbobacillus altaicus]|uniref:Uncharacterized protein n=1 Tax=Candidatus Carbonibacillus altaicus TaxID=2163959 RepID=A0A2R6XXY5_9BACL|nr:MAG: hypothetical protein BSOLF_2583 [Candidatus Carbobacillus altaicus]
MRKAFLITFALTLIFVGTYFFTEKRAESISVGARVTAIIEGKSYVGVWREVGGKMMFFPDPTVNKGPCGEPYCVYVADDNMATIQTVRRDAVETRKALDNLNITVPNLKIEQLEKGSPYIKFIFEPNTNDPDENRGSRKTYTKIYWTPQAGDVFSGQKQSRGSYSVNVNGTNPTEYYPSVDSLIRGPGIVTFDTDNRVGKFMPESPFESYGVFDPNFSYLKGIGETKPISVYFDFYTPNVSISHSPSNADSSYVIRNDNKIPFNYKATITDVRGTVKTLSGSIGAGQSISGTVSGPPSRTTSSNQTLSVTFFDPRGNNHLNASTSDYYKVATPSIALRASVSYVDTSQTKEEVEYKDTGCTYGPDKYTVYYKYRWQDASYTVYSTVTNNNNFPETINASVGSNSSSYTLNGGSSTSGPQVSGTTSYATISGRASSPAGSSSDSVIIEGRWVFVEKVEENYTCNPAPPPPPPKDPFQPSPINPTDPIPIPITPPPGGSFY